MTQGTTGGISIFYPDYTWSLHFKFSTTFFLVLNIHCRVVLVLSRNMFLEERDPLRIKPSLKLCLYHLYRQTQLELSFKCHVVMVSPALIHLVLIIRSITEGSSAWHCLNG